MNDPELLAPAGNPEALDAAIGEGADAVYLGLRSFNARMRSSNFAFNQFEAAVETLHQLKKRIYVTVNTVFEERESDRMYQLLQYLDRIGPDGVIVQDLGVVKLARGHFPALRLHASTQMNVAGAPGANYLSRLGFKRVVLARECSLEEIASVRRNTNIEIETFVHGALCVSGSGICLYSSWLGGKSANRGTCAQACRRLYAREGKSGYFFSPDDLELISKVPALAEAGVNCFKIEGRMKSADYVGTVTAAYRFMIDNWRKDPERALVKAQAMLKADFARRKTLYWFEGRVEPDFIRPEQAGGTGISLGKVRKIRVLDDDEARWALLSDYQGIAEGDSVRIHSADDQTRATSKVRELRRKSDGMYLKLDCDFKANDDVYLVQSKVHSRRYKQVLPAALERFRNFPSYDRAPMVAVPRVDAKSFSAFPDGCYAMVSRISDLHTLLSIRPVKAVIRFTRKNAEQMRKHEGELPFKRDSLVLWLEPFFPESDSQWLSEELDYWISRGQRHFIVNNLGHFGVLKGKEVSVMAGSFLYAFNPYAAAFLMESGVACILPPLEISKQNLFRVSDGFDKRSWMVTVFAFPQLFTVRADLGDLHDFRFFADRDDRGYELVSERDGSVVIPANPFSLIDRIPFLKSEKYGKFLLDFSYVDLKKPLYKQVMTAVQTGRILPETERFNWKNGFWAPDDEKRPAAVAENVEQPASSVERGPKAPFRRAVKDSPQSTERPKRERGDSKAYGSKGSARAPKAPVRGKKGAPKSASPSGKRDSDKYRTRPSDQGKNRVKRGE